MQEIISEDKKKLIKQNDNNIKVKLNEDKLLISSLDISETNINRDNKTPLKSTIEEPLKSIIKECCFKKFLKKTADDTSIKEELQSTLYDFFGKSVSEINGSLCLARNAPQFDTERMIIDGKNHTNLNNTNKETACECDLIGNCTLFITDTGALEMGSGSIINILQDSKLLIFGKLTFEPKCVINIGSSDKVVKGKKINGTGGHLIINAEKPIDLTNLTINLYNKDSYLEVHGNDISLSENNIHRFNDQATVHLESITLVKDFVPAISSQNDED